MTLRKSAPYFFPCKTRVFSLLRRFYLISVISKEERVLLVWILLPFFALSEKSYNVKLARMQEAENEFEAIGNYEKVADICICWIYQIQCEIIFLSPGISFTCQNKKFKNLKNPFHFVNCRFFPWSSITWIFPHCISFPFASRKSAMAPARRIRRSL